MGIRCSKPPRYAPPKYSPLNGQQVASRKRLRKLTKLYDAAVDAGNLRARALYGSELLAICKGLGYTGPCTYPDVRFFAGEVLCFK